MATLSGTARRFFTYSFKVYDRALRITREGWFFVGFTFAVGVAAINTGNNLMYMVLAMMLGVVAVSGVLSESVLSRINVERRLPVEIWAAKPFDVEYVLTNPKRLFPSYSLRLQEKGIKSLVEPFVLKLSAGQRTVAGGSFIEEKRGALQFSQSLVITRFPFGLFEKTKLVDLKDRMVVFPSPIFDSGDGQSIDDRGLMESGSVKGEGSGLFGLREFRDGDNPRRIHWKTTARAGRLILKETEASDIPKIALVLDTSGYRPGRDDQALEDAISRCTGHALRFIEMGHMVRFITQSCEVPYGRGGAHLRAILTNLAMFQPEPTKIAGNPLRPGEAHIVIKV